MRPRFLFMIQRRGTASQEGSDNIVAEDAGDLATIVADGTDSEKSETSALVLEPACSDTSLLIMGFSGRSWR